MEFLLFRAIHQIPEQALDLEEKRIYDRKTELGNEERKTNGILLL